MAMTGSERSESKERGKARVVRPDRSQLSWDLVDPEAWLPADHIARLVWAFVLTLDLDRLYDKVQAREGEAGRPAADPAVQLALWLLATIEGVGSARALDRLTERHLAYRWLCCGVPVNYHGLADFRVAHADVLDELLTQSLASLMAEGFIDPRLHGDKHGGNHCRWHEDKSFCRSELVQAAGAAGGGGGSGKEACRDAEI
jgi:transposase